jgi:hypothetical protein
MFDNFGCNETNAMNIRVAIFSTKAESAGEIVPHNVTI